MKKNKPKITLLGTMHFSKESKNIIKKAFKKYKFDCILTEGVEGKISNKNHWVREPFLMIPLSIYFYFLSKFGKDFVTLKDLCKKYNIQNYNVDIPLKNLIKYFNKWYNYLIYFIVFLIVMIIIRRTPLPKFMLIILGIILSLIFYFGYFVIKTKNIRDKSFCNNCKKIIKKYNYNKILLVCGKAHIKSIKENIKYFNIYFIK